MINIKNISILKSVKIIITIFFGSLVAIYSANIALIHFTSPANERAQEKSTLVNTFGSIEIYSFDKLKSGGLSLDSLDYGESLEVTGYVNLLKPENIIYIDSDWVKNRSVQSTYLYHHELAHILQKEMIAEKTGGYPSKINPFMTFSFIKNMLELDKELSKVMPEPEYMHSSALGTKYLEVAADCFSQPNENDSEMLTYVGTYTGEKACNQDQKRLALQLINTNEWFEAAKATKKLEEKKLEESKNL